MLTDIGKLKFTDYENTFIYIELVNNKDEPILRYGLDDPRVVRHENGNFDITIEGTNPSVYEIPMTIAYSRLFDCEAGGDVLSYQTQNATYSSREDVYTFIHMREA